MLAEQAKGDLLLRLSNLNDRLVDSDKAYEHLSRMLDADREEYLASSLRWRRDSASLHRERLHLQDDLFTARRECRYLWLIFGAYVLLDLIGWIL